MDNIEIKDLNIDEIFNEVINIKQPLPNSYPLEFDITSLKDLFEFLLEFITMICKFFYSDIHGTVDLTQLSQYDFVKINKYMLCIGFSSNFNDLTADSTNLEYADNNRYDRKCISVNAHLLKLKDLTFGLRCKTRLFVISFDFIPKF